MGTVDEGEQPTPIVAPREAEEFDAPAHVFTPRKHAPHLPLAVATPDLASLPKLRTRECFAGERLMKHRSSSSIGNSAPGLGLSGVGAGGGGLGFGHGQGSGNHATAAPRPVSPPAQAAPPAPEAKSDGAAKSSARRAAPAEHESAASSAPAREEAFGDSVSTDDAVEIAGSEMAAGGYHDWGSSIYLSNDDTMSLSSAQRVMFAIDRFAPLPLEHIRPHELLNYFSFDTAQQNPGDDFSIKAQIDEKPGEPGIYSLALAVRGRSLDVASRRNAALSFVIDRSGSMSDEGRMDYLKLGLARMTDELKRGDLVNLVLFDHEVCVPVSNFVVGRDSTQVLRNAISNLEPRGSTDLHSGLTQGYDLADDSYQRGYTNRVVMITDALANTGVTDEQMIAMVGRHYDQKRIRLSGVGVGRDFNDSLLDKLTEKGKGAYVFLGSEAEVDAVFGDRFVSLIETVANDVHFRLHLPPSLRMNVFYGEESSTVKEDVQAIHYFAGTSQLFLSDLMARGGALRAQDSVMLTVEYEHPETGKGMVEEFAFRLGDIARETHNVQKGRLVMSFVDGLYDLASRHPERVGYTAGSWIDPTAFEQCALGRRSLREQQRGLEGDSEVQRVVTLWDRYCSRYQEPPRQPVTRVQPQGADVWPGANTR